MQTRHMLIHPSYHNTSFVHHAVHDMESFFWVLLYLCLTRKGPGGARRDELDHQETPDEDTRRLWRVVYCLFDGSWDDVAENKRLLFAENLEDDDKNSEDRDEDEEVGAGAGVGAEIDIEEELDVEVEVEVEEEVKGNKKDRADLLRTVVLPSIHPYFEDLKGLIKDWFRLLQRAHRFRLAERDTIHDQTLELIARTLAELEEKAQMLPEGAPEHELTIKECGRRRKEISRIREAFHDHSSTPPLSTPRTGLLSLEDTPEGVPGEPGAKWLGQKPVQRHQSLDSPLAKKSKKGMN